MNGRSVLFALQVAASIVSQVPIEQQRASIRNPAAPTEVRCAHLANLQDAGQLDVATVLAALRDADETLASMAAAIVRHEWVVLPQALFD
ncbi:MAG: hypothetical protein ABIP94_10690, partial [Planctomycetota bacterium]